MKNKMVFTYSQDGKIFWISEKVFHIPVLDSPYTIHPENEVNTLEISDGMELQNEKVRLYIKVSELINISWASSMPAVFNEEADKLEILTGAIVQHTNQKHHNFIKSLMSEKKDLLKSKYLSLISEIKAADDMNQLKAVSYKLVFEGIHVV